MDIDHFRTDAVGFQLLCLKIGMQDVFGESGSAGALVEKYGLDGKGIYESVWILITSALMPSASSFSAASSADATVMPLADFLRDAADPVDP